MANKLIVICVTAVFSLALSGCVTQQFENGKKPVVQNQANRDDMAATRISLGLGYLKMGDMPQAKQNLEKAKKFSPEMVQVYTAFAHYYETVGENKLTMEAFEKALSLKSDDADTLNNYGVFLCRQGDLQGAEVQMLKAIAVPSYVLVSKSYQNLSACYLKNDKFTKAEMYLQKAVLHNPSSSRTLFHMVQLQYAMGDYQQAKIFEQRFEKVTRRFTSSSMALAYKVYLKLGQRRTAKNYGTMLVKMYPQSWEAQQYLLNELEVIEADNLAKRYQLSQESEQSKKPKKRVVRLSPKKSVTTEKQVHANKIAGGTAVDTQHTVQNSSAKLRTTPALAGDTASVATITASSAAINSALTMTSSADKTIPVSVESIDKANLEEKRTIVLAAPIVEQKSNGLNESVAGDKVAGDSVVGVNPVDDNVGDEIITAAAPESTALELSASEKNQAEIAKDIPLEDREIFHVAKKPTEIIEDQPVVESEEIVQVSVAAKAEPVATKVAAKPQEKPKTAKEVLPALHKVVTGDTLYGISVQYNIKIKALRRWNDLSSKRKIRINDELYLSNPAG